MRNTQLVNRLGLYDFAKRPIEVNGSFCDYPICPNQWSLREAIKFMNYYKGIWFDLVTLAKGHFNNTILDIEQVFHELKFIKALTIRLILFTRCLVLQLGEHRLKNIINTYC
jgi:hypothetical protein